MKKRLFIIALSLLFIIGVVGTFWGDDIVTAASVWNSCPRGEVNDPYPGECHDYIDTNGDNICDRSQPAPVTTTSTAATVTAVSPQTTTTVSISSNSVYSSGQTTATAATSNNIASSTTTATTSDNAATGSRKSYYLLPVLLTAAALYCITWLASAKKLLMTLTHRKIWNVVLLIAAIISTVFGIILILEIDFNIDINLPFNTLFWHVETGIVLGTVAFFHILWHWRYFTKMLKLSGQKV